jgi:acetyl-CoA acetyltransferase
VQPPGTLMEDTAAYGFYDIGGPAAMAFRRHQHLYGTSEEQLALISVTQRGHAQLNPLAVMKEPLSVAESSNALVKPEPWTAHDTRSMTTPCSGQLARTTSASTKVWTVPRSSASQARFSSNRDRMRGGVRPRSGQAPTNPHIWQEPPQHK